jgi:hypothetical protein
MQSTDHFINEGYGWMCKRCRELEPPAAGSPSELPRFFREGEAEEKETRLSSPTLARWTDASHRTLVCPRCGINEEIENP